MVYHSKQTQIKIREGKGICVKSRRNQEQTYGVKETVFFSQQQCVTACVKYYQPGKSTAPFSWMGRLIHLSTKPQAYKKQTFTLITLLLA